MRAVGVAAAFAAMAALAAGCSTSPKPAKPQQAVPVQYSSAKVASALLTKSDLPKNVSVRNQTPLNVALSVESMKFLTQAQPLNGAVFKPQICASMLNSGFSNIADLHGMTRVFAKMPSGVGAHAFQGGMVASAVVPGPTPANLARVLKNVAKCAHGTVTLSLFHTTGTLTQKVINPPDVQASGVVVLQQRVVFPPNVPAKARGFASLFNAQAVYMVQNGMTVWVSTDGSPGVTAVQLASKALLRAENALG